MRRTREAKAETHQAIVAEAARLFREHGIEQTSVAEVMQAAKLTHGGFYRHFGSKDDLAAAAVKSAFDGIIDELEHQTREDGSRTALEQYAARYLSEAHVGSPAIGCPMAALAIEAGRIGGAISQAFADGTRRMIAEIAERLPGRKDTTQARAAHMLATLVGAVVIARATGESEVRDQVLAACRKHLEVP